MSFEGEDWVRPKAGADVVDRIRDNRPDGVDVEIIFPNKGLAMWATPDQVFTNAQCRVWNDWAWEQFGPHPENMLPVASIATGDLDGAMKEIERVAKIGFCALSLPCKPIWGGHDVDHVNYNLPHFDPMWAVDPGSRSADHVPCLHGAGSARGARQWASGSPRSKRASVGCPGCSTRWMRRIASILRIGASCGLEPYRQFYVGQRLSASRGYLAALGGSN